MDRRDWKLSPYLVPKEVQEWVYGFRQELANITGNECFLALQEEPSPEDNQPVRVQLKEDEKAILLALFKAGEPLTHCEEGGIERNALLSKSSATRALKGLMQLGFITHIGDRGGYSLAEKGLTFAHELTSNNPTP